MMLLLNVYPSITASKAYKARGAVQAALGDYYTAKYDQGPEVSQMVRGRAAAYRKYNFSDMDIGKFEIALLTVSTANAIPTLFWLLCNICSDSSLIQEIRKEVTTIVSETKSEEGEKMLSIDITKFETHCPLLVSSYRETIRISNAKLGNRRVMKDTTISDGTHSYLLREGCDVQIPSGIAHLSPDYWGSDFASFNARRFLMLPETGIPRTQKEKDDDKAQKKAYFPFGGGKHLCPGRNFAFAEVLGAAAVMMLGFEVEKSEGGMIVVPDRGRTMFNEAVAKPRGEALKMGAKISRREGWEDVVWKFVC
jgi:cytochrome P450